MRREKLTLSACFAAGAMLFAIRATAQEDAAAEALFNKGLSEMEAGHYDTACPTIKESQRLDPRMGTLFTLAECEAKGGMIASAVAHYDEYLRLFGRLTAQQKASQAGREKVSAAQKAALTPHVPYVTLILRDAPAGTTVKWDDVVFNLPALGVPLPVNPGEHTATTQLPGGGGNLVTRVTIARGERKQLDLKLPPPGSGKPAAAAPAVVAATTAPAASSAPPPDDAATEPSSRKPFIYGAAGVGALGIIVGSVTGLVVIGKKGTIEDNCVETSCNATGMEAADSAKTLGTVSTIAFGVGIVGLGAAAVMLLTEPPKAGAATARSWSPYVADRKDGVVLGVQRAW
jgi:hypothetical protein